MKVDYRDAAFRHWEDASHLLSDNCIANADHLFGISAECALKSIMYGLNMPVREDGSPLDQQHRVHINKLWDEFVTFSQSRNGANYSNLMSSISNPFIDWDISQRYWNRADISKQSAIDHRNGAQKAKNSLNQAILDGVVL